MRMLPREKENRKDLAHSTTPRLLPKHRAMLKASAISRKVAKARGYRSVTKKAELKRLGFGENQRLVPGLLVPIWSADGEVATYQLRPDEPRLRDGKPVKYETPFRARMLLDVPRRARKHLGNPTHPLFITEGAKKADAAVSMRLCCAALLGVWGWRGTNPNGGVTALSDWDKIALKGRKVYVVFDSDVMEKPEVHAALSRLKKLLESRGAEVRMVYLPPGKGGKKTGLDDFFAAGHSVQDLLLLATDELRAAPKNGKVPDRFTIEQGQICHLKPTREGLVPTPLSNFSARVVEDLVLDDGLTRERAFMIKGRLASGKKLRPYRVPAKSFESMNWVTEAWGLKPIVNAGGGSKDLVREAIQRFSKKVRQRRIFTHTGFRKVKGRWVFLTASDALKGKGVEVDLGPELVRYSLPVRATDPVGSMQRSLRLLHVAPLRIMVPLLAAAFRAPLASFLPVDHSIWLEGETGTLKSSLAAVILSHFGKFDRTHLPGSWSSTVNLLEKRAFVLKDTLFVVDDYAPNGADLKEWNSKASRLLRSQGNLAGRGRLKSDLSDRPAFPPRGLILSTGEQHPSGQSVLARTLILDLGKKDVNRAELAVAQTHAPLLRHAMAGYLEWLAPQLPRLRKILRRRFAKARTRATAAGVHLRVPETVAHLWIGIVLALEYAEHIGACSAQEAKKLRRRGWKALVKAGAAQGRAVTGEKPVDAYLRVLHTLVTQKRVTLRPKHEAANHYGHYDHAPLIGWSDAKALYLMPEAAYQQVARFYKDSAEAFPISDDRVRKSLKQEKVSVCDKGRLTTTVQIDGETKRVLRLRREKVESLIGQAFPE